MFLFSSRDERPRAQKLFKNQHHHTRPSTNNGLILDTLISHSELEASENHSQAVNRKVMGLLRTCIAT